MSTDRTDPTAGVARTDFPTRAHQPESLRIAGTVALGILAAGQLANLAYGRVNPGSDDPLMSATYDLSSVSVRLEDGTVSQLSGVAPILLLVFDPECSHSDRIAPSWARWLSDHRSNGIRVLGVSAGPSETAARYARAKGWALELGTLNSRVDGSAGDLVTRRTPWVLAVDQDGRVIAEGHGRSLVEVAQLLDIHIENQTQ